MRILMTSTSGGGHAGPLLPFASAIAAAGGEVLIAAAGAAAGYARAAGLPVLELEEAPAELRDPVFAAARREPMGTPHPRVVAEVFAGHDARAALPTILRACELWRPDAIVHESCEFAGMIAAELTGAARVRVAIGTNVTERAILERAAGAVAERRAEAGLPPDPKLRWAWTVPGFTLAPAALDDPDVPALPGTLRFRAPGAEGGALPDLWPGDDRPLVQLTLGTVAPGTELFPGVYRTALESLARLPVRVLVTTGHDADPEALGPLPASVRAVRWAPQADVVAQAAAIACHGGSGTVQSALAGGVPLAILPLFADQPHNARRVSAAGAGLAVRRPADLGPAVSALLRDPSFRAAAEDIAASGAVLAPVEAAVPVLRELIRPELRRRAGVVLSTG
jgi:UDP:flavonoid glycosyltransferase YjiC (YdhE family)